MSAAPLRELRNRRGERLDFAFHAALAGGGAAAPDARRAIAVLAHGVTSSHDRPWLVELGDALARAGIAALRFSFAGNGASEGRFEEATPAKETEDLGAVLDALAAAGFGPIAVAGHSMGGAVALRRAARDARVRALVTLAGMVHVHRFMQRHFGSLAPGDPMLGKERCRWNQALADEAARIGSLVHDAAQVRIPWLLVHGDADEMVPLDDSRDARAAAAGRPELVVLRGVDHRFTGAVAAMTGAVVPWLVNQLAAPPGRGPPP